MVYLELPGGVAKVYPRLLEGVAKDWINWRWSQGSPGLNLRCSQDLYWITKICKVYRGSYLEAWPRFTWSSASLGL